MTFYQPKPKTSPPRQREASPRGRFARTLNARLCLASAAREPKTLGRFAILG